MKRVAIVVQRCHPSVVGGSEALAWQYAQLLSGAFEVEILTTTALDYLRWRDELPAGEDRRDGILVRRFQVEMERERYWFELHHRLLAEFRRNPDAPPGERIPWREGLQDEFIRFQGPWTPSLTEWLRANHERYDAVLFCTYLYPTTYFSVEAVPRHKRVFVPTLHDEPPAYLSGYRKRAEEFDHILWLTASERDVASRLWNVNRGTVLGMAVEHAEPAEPQTWPEPYLLYCGRIEQGKGCDVLLKGFRHFRRRTRRKVSLLLTGVRNMRLPWWRADVRFLGFVDEAHMRALMAGAAAFVLPSAYESFSIVTLEAMAQRTPVLLNEECTVLAEHVRRSGSGFTFLGVEDLDHAIEKVLDLDPAERRRLGEAGRRYVIEHFSRERIAQDLIAYVRGVTGA